MRRIELNSPAKVNLMLSITGRRDDGFHELVSLVAPLEFGDRIEVGTTGCKGGIALKCDDPNLPRDSTNLAVRAAELFLEASGISEGVRIRIDKRIPIGAGLGGGSSNGATTLRALQMHFQSLDDDDLMKLAAKLGSDCPLFLKNKPLVMRGRGEVLTELPESAIQQLSGREVLLFKPTFSISTKAAYAGLAGRPDSYDSPAESERRLTEWLEDSRSLEDLLRNSMETYVDRKFPALPLMREEVSEKHGVACLMSGSGSCNFAIGEGCGGEDVEKTIRESWGTRSFVVATRIS